MEKKRRAYGGAPQRNLISSICAVCSASPRRRTSIQKASGTRFERGRDPKQTGGEGWADVWKQGHFGWEYKGKRKDLNAAFAQLQQ